MNDFEVYSSVAFSIAPLRVSYSHFMCYIFSSILKVSMNFRVKKHQRNDCLEDCFSTKCWVDL